MKDQSTVIEEFNDIVNMTASDLEKWLKSDDSQSAGWPKEDENGESVRHDSGRKIIAILESNPDKDPEKYSEDQVDHMRKVVSYCKRHLAQEEKTNGENSTEEVKKTKSYASLKNWGHDILKKRAGGKEPSDNDAKAKKGAGGEDQTTGDKRKAPDEGASTSKRRETEKGESNGGDTETEQKNGSGKANGSNGSAKNTRAKHDTKDGEKKGQSKKTEDNDENENDEDEQENEGKESKGQQKKSEADAGDKDDKPAKGPEVGEKVSWNWGNGQPEGKVLDVKAEKTSITTKRGNEASRKGDAEDPAVVIDTGKSKAIKSAHELN